MPKKSLEKRNAIINSAAKLFSNKGYYNTNVKEIAKEANLAVGTVYIYFKCKDDILTELLNDFAHETIENIRPALELDLKPIDKLKCFVSNIVNELCNHPYMSKVFIVELKQSKVAISRVRPVIYKLFSAEIHNIFKSSNGNIDSMLVSKVILGIIQELIYDWIEIKYTRDTLYDQIDTVFDFFDCGLSE